jgi:hypothetical protein
MWQNPDTIEQKPKALVPDMGVKKATVRVKATGFSLGQWLLLLVIAYYADSTIEFDC